MPPHKAYRKTTLGHTLQESLDELIAAGKISQSVAKKTMILFDRSVNNALPNRVKSRVTFKAGKLEAFKYADDTWTLLLKDVEFREIHELANVDRLKIIACDGEMSQSCGFIGVVREENEDSSCPVSSASEESSDGSSSNGASSVDEGSSDSLA